MSGITTHTHGIVREANSTFTPSIILSTKNKIFVPAADCVSESFDSGVIDVQRGCITYVATETDAFSISEALKQHSYGASVRIDYVTIFLISSSSVMGISGVHFSHYSMNPAEPPPPGGIEDTVSDWIDDGGPYIETTRLGPINVTLDVKNMYFIGFNVRLTDLYGFGIEYSLIGD